MSDDIVDLLIDNKVELNDLTINEYEFSEEDFLGKTSVWYGGTQTGKTRHVKTILSKLKDNFSKIILFSPTNTSSEDFKGIIPDCLCIDVFSPETFLRFYKQAVEEANIYRLANKLENVEEVFYLCSNQQQKIEYNSLNARKKAFLMNIDRENIDISLKREKVQKFCKKIDPLLVKYMKSVIAPHRNTLFAKYVQEKRKNALSISLNAFYVIKFLDLNPKKLVIFDDCMNEIFELLRSSKGKNAEPHTEFKNLFSKGRHYFLTSWFLFQDFVALKPWMRDGIKNITITDKSMAKKVFSSFKGEEGKLGLKICNNIFTGDDDDRKIFYRPQQKSELMFTHTTPENPGIFPTNCSNVIKFCEKIHDQPNYNF